MVEPNIIKTKYYTLVSADTGHGKTLWCKKKVAKLLRTTQDRIIIIDKQRRAHTPSIAARLRWGGSRDGGICRLCSGP